MSLGTYQSAQGAPAARTPSRPPGRRRASLAGPLWVCLALTGILLTAPLGATTSPHPSATGPVLAIYQSKYITEQENFTVSIQVADPSAVQFAYFTFCQLSSPLCYSPVAMSSEGGGWYSGTTERMSLYDGMTVGVHAGYNITIEFTNDTNLTEPSFPNAFGNLTVAQEVGGEYMFEMTVSNQLYGLSGVVDDAATGAPISGADVTLTPGNATPTQTSATGAYSFTGLPNGTYTLSVAYPGYLTNNQTIAISGQSVVKDLSISNSSTTNKQPSGGSGGGSSLPGGTTLWLVIGVVIAVVLAVVAVVAVRRRRTPSTVGNNSGGASPPVPGDKP